MRASVPAVLIAAALLAGCGSAFTGVHPRGEASKSAADVIADALAAAKGAKSVHIFARIYDSGQKIGVVDFSATRTAATGTMAVGHGTLEFIRTGARVYLRNGSALHGTWFMFPTSTKTHELVSLLHLTEPTFYFSQLTEHEGSFANMGLSPHNGTFAIELYDSDDRAIIETALKGAPYPLVYEGQDPNTTLLRFDHWNAPVTVRVPAHATEYPGSGG